MSFANRARPLKDTAMRPLALLCLLAHIAAPSFAQEKPTSPGRSAALVARSLTDAGAGFAAQLGPQLAARASSGGVVVVAAEASAGDERQQILSARARGASFLIEAKVTAFTLTTASLLGEERRRLSTTLTWRAFDISSDTLLVGSGQVTESSLADAILSAEEQAAGLAVIVAEKAGAELAARLSAAPAVVVTRIPVAVRILADGLSLPSVSVDADFKVSVSKESLPLELTGFTLTCDGLVIGTVPGDSPTELPKGLREISLSRSGFETWTGRVEVREGLQLTPALRPSTEGLARWRDQITFLQQLVDGAKLNDAEVERVRAAAQTLRNSGFRTNIDLKVDAKELPETVIVPPTR
jgi:hypothetical protein